MSLVIVLNLLIFLTYDVSEVEPTRWQECLQQNVKLSDMVWVERGKSGMAVSKRTVADQLKELKARCRNGKLVDGRGKQIYFYRLTGCWGKAPVNYLEILEHQRNEIAKLRKRYTVFEIPCNSHGPPIP